MSFLIKNPKGKILGIFGDRFPLSLKEDEKEALSALYFTEGSSVKESLQGDPSNSMGEFQKELKKTEGEVGKEKFIIDSFENRK